MHLLEYVIVCVHIYRTNGCSVYTRYSIAASYLKGYSSASAARSDLGLSTHLSRRKRHLAQFVFKCLSSQSPSYLSQLFSTPSSSYYIRSCSSNQLNLPVVKSSFGQKAFSFTGASLWRLLPIAIRETQDFPDFSRKCAGHFYSASLPYY